MRHFGEIKSVDVGTEFASRAELAASGIHRPTQAGISGSSTGGADSIVVSGGYEDDEDHGDYLIYGGQAGFDLSGGLASNGYGEHSPGKYSLQAGFITEVVMTMMFVMIILGATDKRAPKGFAPIAIGLGLTLIHLISIPVTNTSVNPARSTGVALFAGGWAISQLWLFWIAPIVGAALGAVIYRFIGTETE